jgi:glycosyltransferase involved in cell wall biosynthesis
MTEFYDATTIAGDQRDIATGEDGMLLVSPIPVVRLEGGWHTLDLWARDVNAQAALIPITLICPVAGVSTESTAPLRRSIKVLGDGDPALERSVGAARYIQLPGNGSWRRSGTARKILALARRFEKPVFLGISSNRARTAVINSRGKGFVRRIAALLRYSDIRLTQRWLARRSTGVFVVGAGLRDLVLGANTNVHVGIASWIAPEDIRPARSSCSPHLRICMAGRLELMKGFHLGLEAIALLKDQLPMEVTLIGKGPEEGALKRQAERAGLPRIRFLAPVPYPGPFFAVLDAQDMVLMTNLNDEQPRLIFDAICRGAIPLCPDSPAYVELGLDPRLLYKRGDSAALAECIRRFADPALREEVRATLSKLIDRFTLNAMHTDRLAWMSASVT